MVLMSKAWDAKRENGGAEAGGSEGVRRATGEPPARAEAPEGLVPVRTSSEVEPRPDRREFTLDYKRKILAQADACKGPEEIGALLRREGLYSSHLSKWRELREAGQLGKKRGRPAKADTELARRLQKAERENLQLRRKLKQAEILLEVQKKASEILGISLAEPDWSDETD